jgi:hypothetical protein
MDCPWSVAVSRISIDDPQAGVPANYAPKKRFDSRPAIPGFFLPSAEAENHRGQVVEPHGFTIWHRKW